MRTPLVMVEVAVALVEEVTAEEEVVEYMMVPDLKEMLVTTATKITVAKLNGDCLGAGSFILVIQSLRGETT